MSPLLTTALGLALAAQVAAASPRLIVSASELALLNRRAAEQPEVAQWKRSVFLAADGALAATLELPERGGGWFHDYFCPEHGTRLSPLSPHQHRCETDGKIFSGDPYDAAHVYFVLVEHCDRVHALGLAYGLSGQVEYASRARDYLLALADRYADWPLHGRRPGPPPRDGARMFAQTLDEAIQGLKLLWGYDLSCAGGVYSEADRERIEAGLWREMIRTIRRPPPGPSNWHTWHNAFFLSAGYLLEDATLVERALDGPWGVRDQLRRSVDADGFWHEGAISYHFFALAALAHSAEAAIRNGTDLWSEERLGAMFASPLRLAWPCGALPALNDSWRERIFDYADLYRVAYARTGRPEYRFPFHSQPGGSFEAALYQVAAPPPREMQLAWASQTLPNAGLALLRNRRLPQDGAILKFGPHGGSHGHFDKLGILLYAGGLERLLDRGTVRYGVPAYNTWYKRTLAHNTLVVDEQTQLAETGRTLGSGETPGGDWARAECRVAYTGVHMDRSLFLGPDFLVDVFRVSSDDPHVYDLAYHMSGSLSVNVPCASSTIPVATDASPAYAHLSQVRKAEGDAPWHVEAREGDAPLRLWGSAHAGQTIYFAEGPGLLPQERVPIVLVRREGTETTFVHLLDWSQAGLPWDHTLVNGDVTVRVQEAGARERVVLTFPADPALPVQARLE